MVVSFALPDLVPSAPRGMVRMDVVVSIIIAEIPRVCKGGKGKLAKKGGNEAGACRQTKNTAGAVLLLA